MVWHLLLGCCAFAAFLLFDVAKAKGRRHAKSWFLLGGLLLASATALLLLPALRSGIPAWRIPFGILAALMLLVNLYVLFGALPAKKTYGDGNTKVVTTGVYALCRHPGGWCFLIVYWLLYLFCGGTGMLLGAILFPALNFLYIFVEDRYLFPQYIGGYEAYRREVPFLLPNGRSIRAFLEKP